MMLSGVALIFTVAVIHISHHDPDHMKVPNWARKFFLCSRLPSLLCLTIKYKPDLEKEEIDKGEADVNENDSFIKQNEDVNEWVLIARVIDRVFLFCYILLITY